MCSDYNTANIPYDGGLKLLLVSMLNTNPSQRPCASGVLEAVSTIACSLATSTADPDSNLKEDASQLRNLPTVPVRPPPALLPTIGTLDNITAAFPVYAKPSASPLTPLAPGNNSPWPPIIASSRHLGQGDETLGTSGADRETEDLSLAFNRMDPSRVSRASLKRGLSAIKSQPLFNVGANDYADLVEHGLLIADKTLFLKDFYTSGNKKITITMPRAFGKTTLMSMTKSFFGIPLDPAGKPYADVKDSPAYKLFTQHHMTRIFTKYPEFFDEHFGQQPVIYMSLIRVSGPSEKVLGQFKSALQDSYTEFQYIHDELHAKKEDGTATQAELFDYEYMHQVLDDSTTMSEDALIGGLKRLTKILYNRYHKKSMVMLDDYDTLAICAHIRRQPSASLLDSIHNAVISYLPGFLRRSSRLQTEQVGSAEHNQANDLRNFFTDFINATFKDNKYMSHAIVAGINRVGYDILTGVRFQKCNMQDNEYAGYFGFTDEDLEGFTAILDQNGVKLSDGWKESARNYYNGYTCYTHIDSSVQLYNPYSVSSFLNRYAQASTAGKSLRPQPFWGESAGLEKLRNFFQHKKLAKQIDDLIGGKDIPLHSSNYKDFTLADYARVTNMCDEGNAIKIDDDGVTLFLTYLNHTGYLTIVRDVSGKSVFRIPNEEVRSYLTQLLPVYYEKVYSFSDNLADAVTDALRKVTLAEDPETHLEELRVAFESLMRTNPAKKITESFPHGVFSYLASRMHGITNLHHEIEYIMPNKEKLRPDLTYVLDGNTMTVEKKYGKGEDASTARDEALYYRKVHEERNRREQRTTKRFISLGVHVDSRKCVTMEIFTERADRDRLQQTLPETPKKFRLNKSHKKGQ